jgi:hypothetical protein
MKCSNVGLGGGKLLVVVTKADVKLLLVLVRVEIVLLSRAVAVVRLARVYTVCSCRLSKHTEFVVW